MRSISIEQVAALRAKTGAGPMDCKQALIEANGSETEAIEILKKKGIARAVKKMGREAKAGVIKSYIHAGDKIGVLLELNCETDFVAHTEEFQRLALDICLQIAATNPQYVSKENAPKEVLDKETEIARAQCAGKSDPVVEKIVQGKLDKWANEFCLLDQAFFKDNTVTIKDLIASKIASMGENIVVRRFVRYQLGE